MASSAIEPTASGVRRIGRGVEFEIAINKLWPGEKLPHGDSRWRRHTANFVTERHTIESLIQRVCSDGASFAPTMRGNYRREENFISTQHIGLDDDRGTLESSLNSLALDPFVVRFAAFIYETPSSTTAHPKSRVVFVLDQKFTNPVEYRIAQQAMCRRFAGTDPQVKDPARFFYGRPGAQHFSLGNVLYREVLQRHVIEPYLRHGVNKEGNIRKRAEPIGALIPSGHRNSRLASLAASMLRRGAGETTIVAALIEENRAKCDPPLPEAEVFSIARSISQYHPDVLPPPATGPIRRKGRVYLPRVEVSS